MSKLIIQTPFAQILLYLAILSILSLNSNLVMVESILAQSNATIEVGSGVINPVTGSVTVPLSVDLPIGTSLGVARINVQYDNSTITATGCSAVFYSSFASCNPNYGGTGNTVRLSAIYSPGLTGQNILANITFEAIRPGGAVLTPTVSIPTDFVDSSDIPVPYTTINGDIFVVDDPSSIVINEVDYDQVGTDSAEFIEIKNVSTFNINLDAYEILGINGNGGGAAIYETINLPNVDLASGEYYVICGNSANVVNCDLDVSPDTDLIQNGSPDAVALRLGSSIIDSISYEGNTEAPYTEGTGTGTSSSLADSNRVGLIGLSRFPDGSDTNENSVDFSIRCITPGTANTSASSNCEAPTAITLDSFSAEASAASVTLRWETGTEIDNAGFNLHRASAAAGPYRKINEGLIPAKGTATGGATYSYLDTTATDPETIYYYKLEDIDLNGVSTFHGPVDTGSEIDAGPDTKYIFLPLIVK